MPLSDSIGSSISLKIREAPASAIITMVSCWETWPIGLMNERDRVSRETSVPRVSGLTPVRPMSLTPASETAAPMMASRMYSR